VSPLAEVLTSERPNSAKKVDTLSVEVTPSAGDNSKRESSLQSTPRMRSLTEFATEDELPLLMDELKSKKRKPGRPPGSVSRRKGNKSDQGSVVLDDDWVDEPDVCAFCDDGVEEGEKLLWYGLFFPVE